MLKIELPQGADPMGNAISAAADLTAPRFVVAAANWGYVYSLANSTWTQLSPLPGVLDVDMSGDLVVASINTGNNAIVFGSLGGAPWAQVGGLLMPDPQASGQFTAACCDGERIVLVNIYGSLAPPAQSISTWGVTNGTQLSQQFPVPPPPFWNGYIPVGVSFGHYHGVLAMLLQPSAAATQVAAAFIRLYDRNQEWIPLFGPQLGQANDIATDGEFIATAVTQLSGSTVVAVYSPQNGNLLYNIPLPPRLSTAPVRLALRGGRLLIAPVSGGDVSVFDLTNAPPAIPRTSISATDPMVDSIFQTGFGATGAKLSSGIVSAGGVHQYAYVPVVSSDHTQAAVFVQDIAAQAGYEVANAAWLAWLETHVPTPFRLPPLMYASRPGLRGPHAGSARYSVMTLVYEDERDRILGTDRLMRRMTALAPLREVTDIEAAIEHVRSVVLIQPKDELAAVNWLLEHQPRLARRELPAILPVRAHSAAYQRLQEARLRDLAQ
jgi:hypothetical protein